MTCCAAGAGRRFRGRETEDSGCLQAHGGEQPCSAGAQASARPAVLHGPPSAAAGTGSCSTGGTPKAATIQELVCRSSWRSPSTSTSPQLSTAFENREQNKELLQSSTDTANEILPPFFLQATGVLRGAMEEIQAALKSMHSSFAADSEDIQREWLKFTQKVRSHLTASAHDVLRTHGWL